MIKFYQLDQFFFYLASLFMAASLQASACNDCNGPRGLSNARCYYTFNYSNADSTGGTGLTGIRQVEHSCDELYITGIYSANGQSTTFVYKGRLSGEGQWYPFNYPSDIGRTVTLTSLYGPNNGPNSTIQIVGSYKTQETGTANLGCLYEGPLDGSGEWTTLIPPSSDTVLNTIAHSTMGGLVVGNYDTLIVQGKAFIYDMASGEYTDIVKTGAKSITAYGIWHNGGNSYTLCGGYSNLNTPNFESAYLVDWDRSAKTLSNWRTYNYENNPLKAVITHFDGITSDGRGGYYLTGDWLGINEFQEIGFFAHVRHRKAVWSPISYPNQGFTSGNSVSRKVVIGIYKTTPESPSNGFISVPREFNGKCL